MPSETGSFFAIRLPLGMGRGKGLELYAIGEDPGDGRIGAEVQSVALRIDHLRHQGDVGEARAVAVAELAGPPVAGKQAFERAKAAADPVVVPGLDCRLVVAERPAQIAQYAQIVDR